MNDERMIQELARIRLKMLVLWLVLPLTSIALRFLLHLPIELWNVLPELVLFVLTAFTLIASLIRKHQTSMVDERTIQNAYAVIHRMFYVVIGAVIATHFLRVALFVPATTTSALFVNIFLSITFFGYYLTSIRKGIYFNYDSIEEDITVYRRSVLKRIGWIALFFSALFAAYWIVTRLRGLEVESLVVFVAIGLSTFLTIGQYALLSWLERIHHREQRDVEAGRVRLFHKIAVSIFVITILFNLVRGTVQNVLTYLFMSYQHTTELAFALQIAALVFLIVSIDMLFFEVLKLTFFKKHIWLAFPRWNVALNLGYAALIVLSVTSVLFSFLLQYPQLIFQNSETLPQAMRTLSMVSMTLGLTGGLILITLNVFLFLKGHRFALLQPIAFLIGFTAPFWTASLIISNPFVVMIVQTSFLLITTVLNIVYIIKGSKTFVILKTVDDSTESESLNQPKADAI